MTLTCLPVDQRDLFKVWTTCGQNIMRRNSVDAGLYAVSINLDTMIEIFHNSQVKS